MEKRPGMTSGIDTLFTEYSASLCLYARQWLNGNAEDAVQEAFVKLLGQKAMPGNVREWLFTTVRNECISRLRKKQVRENAARTMQANGKFWFVPENDNNLDAETVQAALNELEVELREVVTLRLWGQLGFEEMSQVTGISVSTLHNRYQRAIKILQEQIRW